MEGSNRVEPLNKDENELKRRPLSVLVGAQNSEQVRLRNEARKWCKRGDLRLTLEDKSFFAS